MNYNKSISNSIDPITNSDDIKKIKTNIKNNPRNLLLFDLIADTGIGLKKLLSLKVKDILGVKEGERIAIDIGNNSKFNNIMTEAIYKSFIEYMNKSKLNPDDFLFKSKKGDKPINLSSASNMIKGWFREADINSTHCATSLRKIYRINKSSNDNTTADNNSTIISSGIFKPIKTTSAQEIVYNKLSEAIIMGKILPGSRLTTAEIAKAFNVSHAPARVALNWLEAKGFITAKKKKASIVKELSINELKEIIQIRLILENAAAELSYKICTEETIKLAESIIRLDENTNEVEDHFKLNALFHKTIYRDANMPILLQMISDLCTRITPYLICYHSTVGITHEDALVNNIYHRRIIEGIRDKDLGKMLNNLDMDLNKSTPGIEKIMRRKEMNTGEVSVSFAV